MRECQRSAVLLLILIQAMRRADARVPADTLRCRCYAAAYFIGADAAVTTDACRPRRLVQE